MELAYAAAPQVTYAAAPQMEVAYAAAPQVKYAAAPTTTTTYAAPLANGSQTVTYASAPEAPQAQVTGQVGQWLICQDAQGEFYQDSSTGQQFDQPPAHLLQLMQAQGGVY